MMQLIIPDKLRVSQQKPSEKSLKIGKKEPKIKVQG